MISRRAFLLALIFSALCWAGVIVILWRAFSKL